jgi:amidase
MKVVNRTNHHTLMDCSLNPAVRIAPGEQLVIETLDACYGRVRSVADFERYRNDPNRQTDPLTGPVFVEGARPDGGLVVEILDVLLDREGFQLIGPQRAIIRDEVLEWDFYSVTIRDGKIILPRGLEMPIEPVVGTLGNAPAGEPTNRPNRLGGNLDCPAIRPGVKVYLPIEVEGAMFFLGDLHARQGDGEVVGAPEIGGRVTVRFDVLDEPAANWPLVEDDECFHVVAGAATEEDAIRIGTFEAARLIQSRHGISWEDAMVLLTMCVSLRCSRTGGHGDLERVVCTSFPKSLISHATRKYQATGKGPRVPEGHS